MWVHTRLSDAERTHKRHDESEVEGNQRHGDRTACRKRPWFIGRSRVRKVTSQPVHSERARRDSDGVEEIELRYIGQGYIGQHDHVGTDRRQLPIAPAVPRVRLAVPRRAWIKPNSLVDLHRGGVRNNTLGPDL